MDSVKLSIIVPVFNTQRYLRRCIDSLLDQGFMPDEYEILFVNDGSTDNSLDILCEYSLQNQNIRIITQANAGVSAARNNGIEQAKGEFVCFVDSDDAIVPSGFSYLYNLYVNESVDMVRFYVKFECGEDKPITKPLFSDASCIYEGLGAGFLQKYGCETFCVGYLYRRSFLVNHQLRFEKYQWCEDLLFVTSALLCNPWLVSVSLNVYIYYIRSNSATTTRSSEYCRRCVDDWTEVSDLLLKKAKSLGNSDLFDSVNRSLSGRMPMVFSRALYANYSLTEFRNLMRKCKAMKLMPMRSQISSISAHVYMLVLNTLYYIPFLYIPTRILYTKLFTNYIQPRLLRV